MGSLQGRVVAVSGASSGIGLAVARRFAAEGAEVVMLARREGRLAEAAASVGPRAVAVRMDVSDPTSVTAAFDAIRTRFGKLDVLLNVAGIARVKLIADASDSDIQDVVNTNFVGPIFTTRAAIPLMVPGGGDIVNVSSEITLDDFPYMTLYSTSKRALDGFTRTMTKELRPQGIRVGLVVMGTVAGTSFVEDNFDPIDAERAEPAWEADGYLTRVAGVGNPINVDWVADALLYVVTRPRDMMLDVIHVRSVGTRE